MLHSESARRLYHEFAANEPVLDYHSHLPASQIAENHRFRDLTEIWLEGDHYKWRAMRANGVAEQFCSGDASPLEKFEAWAGTVPFTLRNPLYHWTHLELQRYFGIDELLSPASAKCIWERANRMLTSEELCAIGILKKFGVKAICTTDDPCDDLSFHQRVNQEDHGFRLYPTFRPDRALRLDASDTFSAWISQLEHASGRQISNFVDLLDGLKQRHDYFHAAGCRLSDHGLAHCHSTPCSDREAARIFAKARKGGKLAREEHEGFASVLMLFFGRLDAEKNWTKQLHLGALRNVNSRANSLLGPDSGFDCIGDSPQAEALVAYLDLLDSENALPRLVLYNVNPAENYAFATAAGSFHNGEIAAKVQFGSAWWFLDQKEGMEWQLNALSNAGLLSRFIGMTTDSRSFMSFPRHEYFRRLLCDILGREMERGELPNDQQMIGGMVKNICFENARRFLGLEVPSSATAPLAS